MASSRVAAHLTAALALAGVSAAAQTFLSLEQAAARAGDDFRPVHERREVTVRGQISMPALRIVAYSHLPIQDSAAHGLVLEGSFERFAGLQPGDWVEARGTISHRAGLPVLLPEDIIVTARGPAPAPRPVPLEELDSFRYLGVQVVTEGEVVDVGHNAGGDYLLVGERRQPLKVFLPRESRRSGFGLEHVRAGDRVRVTGLSSQYTPIPPYDRMFQLVIAGADSAEVVRRGALIPAPALAGGLAFLALLVGIWWLRERRMASQRAAMRTLNALGEDILGARSSAEILTRLAATLPRVLRVTGVRLYLYDSGKNSLEEVPRPEGPPAACYPLDVAVDAARAGPALCFRNRTLIAVPDTRRIRRLEAASGDLPRAVMFVPLLAQKKPAGVLELNHAVAARQFSQDQQAAAQHLGNQVATTIKLLEQQAMREQLFRSEKLAAAGQLITAVVRELRAPLETIAALTGRWLENPAARTESDLRAVAAETDRATRIVTRLDSLARADQPEARPFDLTELLRRLLAARRDAWRAAGLRVEDMLRDVQALVSGSSSQLEQVFADLLTLAARAVAKAPAKMITVSATLLARRALVEIGWSAPQTDVEAPAFDVCRGIIQAHGGEIRAVRTPSGGSRFEVELPLAHPAETKAEPPRSGRPLTILLVEPEAAARRQLLVALGGRDCRVVPVASGEEAAEVCERLRFDALFCSLRLPGLSWVELSRHTQARIPAFVLLSEGRDPGLSGLAGGDSYVLGKPVRQDELDSLLSALESRLEKVAAANVGS